MQYLIYSVIIYYTKQICVEQRSTPVQYRNQISYTREKQYLKCFTETKIWYLHKKTTKFLQDCLIDYLEASKQKYYSSRLTSSKVYRLILKSILNDEKNNFITPLFTTNLVIMDSKKANLFDKKHPWISNSTFQINHRLPAVNFS